MPAFNGLQTAIVNRTIDLSSSATIQIDLVTSAPSGSNATRNDLTLVSGGNYAPQVLSGRSLSTSGQKTILDFSDPVFTGLYAGASTAATHAVYSQKVGGSPATSDPLIAYTPLSSKSTSYSFTSCTGASGTRVIYASDGTFTGIEIGSSITGTNVAGGTTVLWVSADGSSIGISADLTGAVSGTLTGTQYTASPRTMPTSSGSALDLTIIIPTDGILTWYTETT